MRKLIVILLSLISTIVVAQSPIYSIIPASKCVKYTFDKPSDSLINVLHNYVNDCRKDLPTTGKRIGFDLSDYNQHLQPFVMNNKLNKEAQRRCEEYVNFYLNYHWFYHMYEGKFSEAITMNDSSIDTIGYRKIIKEHEKQNTPHNNRVVKYLREKLNQKPTKLIDNFLYEDGDINIMTGHRDMLLSKDDILLFNENQIGYGYIEYKYKELINGVKINKTLKFLVILVTKEKNTNGIIPSQRNDLATIKNDYFISTNLYKHLYNELMKKRKIISYIPNRS